MPHSLKHIINRDLRFKAWFRALLEHPRSHKDGVPVRLFRVVVVVISPPDVRLWRVADKVDRRRRQINPVCRLPPLLKQPRGECEGVDLWLAERSRVQLLARDGFVHCFERDAQRAHADARQVVRGAPDDVVVREEERRALVEVRGACPQPPLLRHQQVEDDLLVRRPVARVGEDEDGVDFDVGEVARARTGELVACELAEGRRVLVVLDDVAWCDADVLYQFACALPNC